MRGFCRVQAILLALLAPPVSAADPPAKGKRPVIPPAPAGPVVPAPMPSPDAPIPLPEGVELLISHDAKCLVAAFPKSKVSVRTITVPAGRTHTLSGRFIDPATGKVTEDDQTFAGPCVVYRVKPAEDGPCELFVAWGLADDEFARVRLDCQLKPRPPPEPPKPPEPPPAPVTSFRVFLVYESGATLTAAQNGVLYGKAVEDYLNAKCTGGKSGWRRRDKDAPGDADPATAALWKAIQPHVTTTPCAAVEVNGKVEIIPLAATPADMVAVLKKYAGEK